MKKLLTLAAIMVLAPIILIGCGKNASEIGVAGSWGEGVELYDSSNYKATLILPQSFTEEVAYSRAAREFAAVTNQVLFGEKIISQGTIERALRSQIGGFYNSHSESSLFNAIFPVLGSEYSKYPGRNGKVAYMTSRFIEVSDPDNILWKDDLCSGLLFSYDANVVRVGTIVTYDPIFPSQARLEFIFTAGKVAMIQNEFNDLPLSSWDCDKDAIMENYSQIDIIPEQSWTYSMTIYRMWP